MRLFLALTLEGPFTDMQRQLSCKGSFPKTFHLTLQFLGEVKNSEDVIACMQGLHFSPIDLQLDKISAFTLDKPRVIFAAFKDDAALQQVLQLQQELERRLQRIGFRPDKPFHPHITLARVKDMHSFAEIPLTGMVHVQKCCLFKSTLTAQGAVHEELFCLTSTP
ncbi:MAG: RNA 2',3'-cyclic phosphodiesterase [archaeon]